MKGRKKRSSIHAGEDNSLMAHFHNLMLHLSNEKKTSNVFVLNKLAMPMEINYIIFLNCISF